MKKITDLIDVKSIVTLAMTGAMIALLFAPVTPNAEAQSLFCTAYGAIITYFFTRPQKSEEEAVETADSMAIGFDTDAEWACRRMENICGRSFSCL